MANQTENKHLYVSAFQGFEKSLNGKSASPIHALRKKAIGRFEKLGFPTTHDEAWVHTSVASVAKTAFVPATRAHAQKLTLEHIHPYLFDREIIRLVFVNGFYRPELSIADKLPKGVLVSNLADALETHPQQVESHLGRHAPYKDHAFAALNTAFIQDGAFIHVSKGTVVEEPIHIVFISAPGDASTISHPRSLVVAEAASQVTLIESYGGEGTYFTNAVTEIIAEDNAIVDHYKIEQESPQACHIATLQTSQGRTSNVSSHTVCLGGRLVRNEVNALLGGEGCEATINGFYLTDKEQHVDNHTLIEHAEPNCSSHELYKGILGGASRGVFRGKIYVHQKAQKTDAYQANQNLLLTDDAHVNTKPQLEIYADDVKCSHGATIGQLDEDAVYYLRARGVNKETARQILVQAFAGDILDRVKVEPLRRTLEKIVMQKFEQARTPKDTQ